MQHSISSTGLVELIRKTLMVIGILMFVLLGGMTAVQTGGMETSRSMDNPQPELQAVTLFSR